MAKSFYDKNVRNSLRLKQIMSNKKDVPEIRKLTFNTKTSVPNGLTRKHNLAMNGHIGHGRNLSQSINFMTFNYERKGNYPSIGFGSDI